MIGIGGLGKNDNPIDDIHTNEELQEAIDIDMGAIQRHPFWGCVVMVFDTDKKGSPL